MILLTCSFTGCENHIYKFSSLFLAAVGFAGNTAAQHQSISILSAILQYPWHSGCIMMLMRLLFLKRKALKISIRGGILIVNGAFIQQHIQISTRRIKYLMEYESKMRSQIY
jgi:hypothetical protein